MGASEKIIISITDNQQEDDILSVDNSVNSSWDNESKQLTVELDNISARDVLDSLTLTSNSYGERFIKIDILDGNERQMLDEFVLSPSNLVSDEDSISFSILEKHIDDNFNDDIFSYSLKQTSEGDIYTILKESFDTNNTVELWGYSSGKIDLSSIPDTIDHIDINKDENSSDVSIMLHSGSENYNIVLKDPERTEIKEESILESLILSKTLEV